MDIQYACIQNNDNNNSDLTTTTASIGGLIKWTCKHGISGGVLPDFFMVHNPIHGNTDSDPEQVTYEKFHELYDV